MKTDDTNRLADPENLNIYQVSREFWKKSRKKISRQVAAILIICGELKILSKVISILMGNFTWKIVEIQ